MHLILYLLWTEKIYIPRIVIQSNMSGRVMYQESAKYTAQSHWAQERILDGINIDFPKHKMFYKKKNVSKLVIPIDINRLIELLRKKVFKSWNKKVRMPEIYIIGQWQTHISSDSHTEGSKMSRYQKCVTQSPAFHNEIFHHTIQFSVTNHYVNRTHPATCVFNIIWSICADWKAYFSFLVKEKNMNKK